MRFDSLNDWLAWLEVSHPKKWDLGLARVSEVARRMRLLEFDCPLVLVAGTNGKGSTIATIDALLRSAGFSTGVATSPHLLVFNERICIDGLAVADHQIIAAFDQIDQQRGDISLTYFEFAALASLVLFKRAEPDYIILEIGLGGRLDAMNIVSPDLTIITGIALDHQDWLGADIESIGREKAGILRPLVPVILGSQVSDSVVKAAKDIQAPMSRLGHEVDVQSNQDHWTFSSSSPKDISYGPLPYNQLPLESAALAVQAVNQLGLNFTTEHLEQVLRTVNLAGRYQKFPGEVTLVLDVAHNPHAASHLQERLRQDPVPGATHAIVGMYADKDCESVLAILDPLIDHWYFTGLPESRAETAMNLASRLVSEKRLPRSLCGKVSEAFALARYAAVPGDRILVFGSFPVVAGVLALLEPG